MHFRHGRKVRHINPKKGVQKLLTINRVDNEVELQELSFAVFDAMAE